MSDLAPLYQRLEPNPDAEYGGILPFARNRVGSASWVQEGDNLRFALPAIVRDGLRGYLDLANSTQTGSLTPEALQAMTLGSLGAGVSMAPRGALAAGGSIKAYHGSPHSFDRFDASKIGTGEGAQAYGHGLYFAENPTVASSYKNPNQRPVPISYGGAEYTDQTIRGRTLDDMQSIGKDAALQKLRDNIRFNEKYAPDIANLYKSELDWASNVDPSKIDIRRGHMYEVRINADPERFLNWDRPLASQTPYVQETLGKIGGSPSDLQKAISVWETRSAAGYGGPRAAMREGMNAEEVDRLKRQLFQVNNQPASNFYSKMGESAAAANALSEAGIPGIRYLDAGSRGAGDGSRNYVVFPGQEHLIEILRKYGIAAPAPVAVPAETNTGKPTSAQREAMSRGLF